MLLLAFRSANNWHALIGLVLAGNNVVCSAAENEHTIASLNCLSSNNSKCAIRLDVDGNHQRLTVLNATDALSSLLPCP